ELIDDGFDLENRRRTAYLNQRVALSEEIIDPPGFRRGQKAFVEIYAMTKMAADAALQKRQRGAGVQAVGDLLDQLDPLPEDVDVVFDYWMAAFHSSSALTTGMNCCSTAACSCRARAL